LEAARKNITGKIEERRGRKVKIIDVKVQEKK
jgi:hypothetical protein